MKSNVTFCAIITLFFLSLNLSAQRTVTWIGGTPGQETNWFCYKNWSNSKVPDEFTDVIIANISTTTFHYPVIKSKEAKVNSISIVSQATLTIEKSGKLTINDTILAQSNLCIINKGSIQMEAEEIPTTYATTSDPMGHK